MEDYPIHLPQLRTVVCSHVCCICDVLLLLRTIDKATYVCSEFSEVVLHNKGIFHGPDRKLSIRICMNICLYCPDLHILCFMYRKITGSQHCNTRWEANHQAL